MEERKVSILLEEQWKFTWQWPMYFLHMHLSLNIRMSRYVKLYKNFKIDLYHSTNIANTSPFK